MLGGLISVVVYARDLFEGRDRRLAYTALRHNLGRTILLGLEVLIVADIILTVAIDETLESAATLGLIVLVRTLKLSLNIEMETGARPGDDGRWRAAATPTGSNRPAQSIELELWCPGPIHVLACPALRRPAVSDPKARRPRPLQRLPRPRRRVLVDGDGLDLLAVGIFASTAGASVAVMSARTPYVPGATDAAQLSSPRRAGERVPRLAVVALQRRAPRRGDDGAGEDHRGDVDHLDSPAPYSAPAAATPRRGPPAVVVAGHQGRRRRAACRRPRTPEVRYIALGDVVSAESFMTSEVIALDAIAAFGEGILDRCDDAGDDDAYHRPCWSWRRSSSSGIRPSFFCSEQFPASACHRP